MEDQTRLRREPPPFRRVRVERTEDLSPRLRRITFGGEELEGLAIDEPAASVRLLIPTRGELVIPEWNGNEFLLPDGRRPMIRTFTPRRLRRNPVELDLDVVLHGTRGASGWASRVHVGAEAAVSGPGRGYAIHPDADPLFLCGDETAIPAIAQLLEVLPAGTAAVVHVEVAHPDARIDLPAHPDSSVTWHDLPDGAGPCSTLLAALEAASIGPESHLWVAGEAAGVQAIRKHLRSRGVERARTTVRGYWKAGRAGPG